MNWWQILLVVVAIAVPAYIFRRRIFHGAVFARELTMADFEGGTFPVEFHRACAEMQVKVQDAVNKYYSKPIPADTPPQLREFFGQTYHYAVPLERLCHGVKFYDSFPDGAAANISLDQPDGRRIMGVTKRALQRPSDVMHELAHSLSWDHQELWQQCLLDKRYHWRVMFEPLGPYA